jgi:hypothetical protein
MTNLGGVVQMLKQEHDQLKKQMEGISAALAAFGATYTNRAGTGRKLSAAGRARIAAAQRARWAKLKGKSGIKVAAAPKKRTMSVAAPRKIAAAQRARWAKVKAGK